MRPLHRLALLFIPCAALACSALLGDFSVGNGDGGGDAIAFEGGGDGGGDVNATDAPSDAADAAAPIKCTEDSNSRHQLNAAVGQLPWDLIQIAKLSPAVVRVVVDAQGGSSQNALYSFDYNGNNNPTHASPTTGQIQEVMDILRLKDRFVALTWDRDAANNNFFAIYEMLDNSTTWGPETAMSPLNPIAGGDASAIDRLEATMVPIDPITQNYFIVAYDLEQSDAVSVLYAAQEKPGLGQAFAIVDNTQPPFEYELKAPSLAANAQNVFMLLGANGPSTTNALLYTMSATAPVASAPRVITNTQGASYFPAVFTNSSSAGIVDVAIIEANLNTVQATFQVGQVGFPQLATFDPANLPTSSPPKTDAGASSIPDLLLDKAIAHVESPGTGEHVIGWSRTSDLSGPIGGFNFEWWDAQSGAVRSRETGATNLFKDINDGYRATSVFSAPPLASFAQFDVAFSREPPSDSGGNGGSSNGDLWYTSLSCALQ